MPEPKGRSGKKPKYQIADIGGADLTSEDISTERVLNFLIKGELGSISGKDAVTPAPPEVQSVLPPPEESTPRSIPKSSDQITPSEQPVKKSLSHLFERAGGAQGRESSLSNPEIDSSSVPSPGDHHSGQVILQEKVGESHRSDTPDSVEVVHVEPFHSPLTSTQVESPGNQLPTDSTVEPIQDKAAPLVAIKQSYLDEQVKRWKTLYRLNSGEIATLQALLTMAGENDSASCFVKMRNLAEASGLDYRYCQKVVRSLERLGWITKLQDYDAATQLGVLYRVNSKPLHLS